MPYGDIPSCNRCGDTYELRPGCEPTPECDSCAHIALAETRAALETLLDNSAVITKPGEDPCFVDLQVRSADYEAAYNLLPNDKSYGEGSSDTSEPGNARKE